MIKAGFREKALAVLDRIGGAEFAAKETSEIELSLTDAGAGSGFRTLFKRKYRKVLILGLLLSVFVQITGINTVVDYAPKILMAAGLEIKNALLQTSLIGLVNFSFTNFLSMAHFVAVPMVINVLPLLTQALIFANCFSVKL